jgi:K+-transporting ATPase A subunit
MNMNKKTWGLVILLGILALNQIGLAQYISGTEFPQSGREFSDIVKTFFRILFVLIAIVAVIFIMLGAFQFLTAGGDPDKAAQGKRQVIYAVIGLFVAAAAWALVEWFVKQLAPGGSTLGF